MRCYTSVVLLLVGRGVLRECAAPRPAISADRDFVLQAEIWISFAETRGKLLNNTQIGRYCDKL